jgi:hypothetical protein
MRLRILVLAHLALAPAACSDSFTAPGSTRSLEVLSGNLQSALAGNSLDERLAVLALDEHNQPARGALVTWSVSGGGSIAPGISRTDASGVARATWTLGNAGATQIVKAASGSAKPVRFAAEVMPIPETCSGSPLTLQPGGSLTFSAQLAGAICISPDPLFTRDYVLVAFNTVRAPSSDLLVEVLGTEIVSAANPPTPSPAATRLERPGRDANFELRLRERERHELAPLVRPDASPSPGAAFQLGTPVQGATVALNANSASSCATPIERQGIVRAVSQRAVIVEDIGNPAGGFSTAEYQSIAATFDTLVHPADIDAFGEHTDIDGNGRVVLFYTAEVNKLTPPGAPEGFVAGFFFARDLFPRAGNSRLSGCATSNQAELMYLMVPDPLGSINGNNRNRQFVQERTIATIAHELQHLINASRRLYVNRGAAYPERRWLDEGLAHVAEELVFWRASGLSPRSNVTGLLLDETPGALDKYRLFQAENVARVGFYLDETNSNWLFSGGTPGVATRGAATWFLRYAADRFAPQDANFWRNLVDSPDTGLRNLERVIQADALLWMRDWAAALYVDDAVHDLASKHQQLSWHLRSVILSQQEGETYPLRTIPLLNGQVSDAELEPAGAAFFRFGVAPSIPARLRIFSTGGDAAALSLVLIRTR